MRLLTVVVGLGLLAAGILAPASAEDKPVEKPIVVMKTSKGEILIELDPGKAPITVENFLRYVDEGFFDGTIFHRVIKGFMIQGGGFDAEMNKKATHEPIKNEAGNGLSNQVGTIVMARTNVVDSATAQFFINTVDNPNLNHRSPNPSGFGYAVLGRVVDGMDVVQAIEAAKTAAGGGMQDVPVETIVIESVTRQEK